MLVIGGGIIGLEMATVYSTLGARLDVVEMPDGLMLGADRDLVRPVARRSRSAWCDRIMMSRTKVVEPKPDGLSCDVRRRARSEAADVRPRR